MHLSATALPRVRARIRCARAQMRPPHPPRGTRLLITAVLITAACGVGAADEPGDRPSVVVTTSILGDVTSQVASDDAEVTVLMDAGADPHNFEPSARQLGELTDADLIVTNGGGLEAQLADPIAEAERGGVRVFRATDHIAVLEAGEHHEGEEHDQHADEQHSDQGGDGPRAADRDSDDGAGAGGGGHGGDGGGAQNGDDEHAAGDGYDRGGIDPHFWMDPLRMADVARALERDVGAVTGAPQAAADRALRYAGQLRDVDRRVAATLGEVPGRRRTLVTNHETLGYLADRYDYRVVGTIIPGVTTVAMPSAQDIEELARTIRETGVHAIFTDSTAPQDLAQTLAAEVGTDVQVVQLYSEALGGTGTRAETYIEMLETDAGRIARALAAGATAAPTADPTP